MVTNLVYVIWGDANAQPWDNPNRKAVEDEVKENGTTNNTENDDEKATRF